jgi:hypothetical protein
VQVAVARLLIKIGGDVDGASLRSLRCSFKNDVESIFFGEKEDGENSISHCSQSWDRWLDGRGYTTTDETTESSTPSPWLSQRSVPDQ